jgi:hypothetical protein
MFRPTWSVPEKPNWPKQNITGQAKALHELVEMLLIFTHYILANLACSKEREQAKAKSFRPWPVGLCECPTLILPDMYIFSVRK